MLDQITLFINQDITCDALLEVRTRFWRNKVSTDHFFRTKKSFKIKRDNIQLF
jgi:hypothetical protein